MAKIYLKLIVLLLFICYSCSDESFNDSNNEETSETENQEFIDPNAYYVDQDHPNASDDNNGRYLEDGGTGPWKTIQKMLDVLAPGEIGYIRESKDTYIPTIRTNAHDIIAFFITKSGTIDQPIVIAGYPGERPRIGFPSFEDAIVNTDKAYSGFVTDFVVTDVILQNMEIANLYGGSGIFTNPDTNPPNLRLVFEKLYIHDILGIDNIGGIRVDGCDDCIIRNNIIHSIYDTHTPHDNPFTTRPYALHSGIHAYQPGNVIVENNLIYNVDRAVFQKQSDIEHKQSFIVRNNILHNIRKEAFGIHNGVAGQRNAECYNNVVYNAGSVLRITHSGEQGIGAKFYNNTVVDTKELVFTQETIDVEIFNNIYVGDAPPWTNSAEAVSISTGKTIGSSSFKNSISFIDQNIYYNILEHFMLERDNGSYTINVYGLDNWQNIVVPDLGLAFKPDQNSRVIDPLFTAPEIQDFSLQSESPALSGGRGEEYPSYIGAIGDGEAIGPNWSVN